MQLIGLVLYISLIHAQSQFRGNRTHYPSLKSRPEAALADIKFETTGSGIVTILNPYSRVISENTKKLQLQRSLWASMNQIRILYRNFNEAETYDDYIEQVIMACSLSEATSFDIIWVNASTSGILSKCLVDLYAWDYNIGDGHDQILLSNSIINDRLVTLPAVSLVGNHLILSKYGHLRAPKSLDELEETCKNILMNERAMENYKLACITGAFGSISEFMTIIVTWMASVNAKIIDGKNVTIASDETASILERINTWLDDGIIALDDFEQSTVETSDIKFRNGHSVFMIAQLSQLNALNQNPPYFEYSAYPYPGSKSNFVGTLGGWSLGVYKFSRNPTAAIKTIKWMTSEEAQKNAILLSQPVLLLPTRNILYQNDEICHSMGQLCETFKAITPIIPPWQIAGSRYYNISKVIAETFKSIIIREIDVNSGLQNLYLFLKSTFKLDGTFFQIEAPFRPVKKGYSHLTAQVWILSVFCTGSVLLAVAYRLRYTYLIRKQNEESSIGQHENEKPISLIPLNSLKAGPYQKLEENEIDFI